MSGLAGLLAGHTPPGIYEWHGAFDATDVAHTVEHAGWTFGHIDGWTQGSTKAEFLTAIGAALHFPDYYGHNFDALDECLLDVGAGTEGIVLLWDGWGTLAREDQTAFGIALSVLGSRSSFPDDLPFAVLLRGEGPEIPGLTSLD